MILVTYIALLSAVIVVILVIIAIVSPSVPNEDKKPNLSNPSTDVLQAAYHAATQMHIETDRAMWQIVAIYVPASVLIMGWVISRFNDIKEPSVVIAGSIGVLLVGVATLFKHRLRLYNKVREDYLRRLEEALMESDSDPTYWGLHHVMDKAFNNSAWYHRWVSVHRVVDIYFFLHIFIWVALWVIVKNR